MRATRPNFIDVNASSSVTLTNAEWQTILGVLAEGPFRVVNQLMQSIANQVQSSAGDGGDIAALHQSEAS
jgi:hypothetical protein